MRSRNAYVAAAMLACLAVAAAPADSPRPRRTLGFSYAAEGYGGPAVPPAGELASLGLALEPFRGRFLVPSVSAIASIPVFPLAPDATLLEARIDLRLATFSGPALDRAVGEPTLYAPAISASWIVPADGSGSFAALGARPLVLRIGDGVYSILSPALVLDPRDASARGFSIELFEFTHFLF